MGRISKLHEYTLDQLNSKFTHLHVQENFYPEWLLSPVGTRLELDIFIEELNIAVEIQGDQHSRFVPFFHGTIDKFNKQKEYDEHKQYLCREQGVRLYDLSTEKDSDIMVYEIGELLDKLDENKPKYYYQNGGGKEKYHEIEKRKAAGLTRKGIKKSNVNSEERMKRRLDACVKSLSMFENGELLADEQKVSFWQAVIKSRGYSTNE